jgi:hypothetical protein
LCGEKDYRPSLYLAVYWFNKSIETESLCQRVYAFCVGSNYFADGFLPTNKFIGGYSAECAGELEKGVDKKIIDEARVWEVNARCRIKYLRTLIGQNITETAKQQFRVTNEGIKRIVDELVSYGTNLSSREYVTTTSTSSTTTSSSSTSTTSTTTSTTLTATTVAEETKENGSSTLKIFSFAVVVVIAYVYLSKSRRKEGKNKPQTLLSASEHKQPTHLESV